MKVSRLSFAKSRKKSSRELFAWIGPAIERTRARARKRACAYCVCGYARAAWACADTRGSHLRVISVEAY